MEKSSLERATVTPASAAWGDNRSRYHFCGERVAGQTVLDIACGSGYGATILREHGARFVVGCDSSAAAISEGAAISTQDVALTRGSGTHLPFAEGSFDAVVSLETIEHIDDDSTYVREVRRVLRGGGMAIFSTPSALYTRPVDGVPSNPFHVREYTPKELRMTLEASFDLVELLGQRVASHCRPCPQWELPEDLPSDIVGKVQTRWWRLQDRFLSDPMKDRLSRFLFRRSFYPGENDFSFSSDDIEKAHVLVALCMR